MQQRELNALMTQSIQSWMFTAAYAAVEPLAPIHMAQVAHDMVAAPIWSRAIRMICGRQEASRRTLKALNSAIVRSGNVTARLPSGGMSALIGLGRRSAH